MMKNDIDTHTSTFLDTITSNLFVPQIIHPTRITKCFAWQIWKSDQFLIIPLDFCYARKINLYKHDTRNFVREIVFQDLISIDWNAVLKLENENPNKAKSTIMVKIFHLFKNSNTNNFFIKSTDRIEVINYK